MMAIEQQELQKAFLNMHLVGDAETGLLRRFDVILNASQIEFLVSRELDFIQSMGESSLLLSKKVLIDAAQWNANATFKGMMTSDQWTTIIAPNVENNQDKLDALVALINCLGWGRVTKANLDEEKQTLTLEVSDSYYLDFVAHKDGEEKMPTCYMWTGVTAGLMDVLFGTNVHDFKGIEVECGAVTGQRNCKFFAKKQKKKFGL